MMKLRYSRMFNNSSAEGLRSSLILLRERKKGLSCPRVAFERVEDDLQMSGVVEEVGVADVYDERADIVLADIVRVGFLDVEEIIIGNALFVGPVTFADIGLQLAYRCVE